jgi:hypothetical protein
MLLAQTPGPAAFYYKLPRIFPIAADLLPRHGFISCQKQRTMRLEATDSGVTTPSLKSGLMELNLR